MDPEGYEKRLRQLEAAEGVRSASMQQFGPFGSTVGCLWLSVLGFRVYRVYRVCRAYRA